MPKLPRIAFVDLERLGFATEPRYYFYGWSDSPRVRGRKSLAEALLRAKKHLPKGCNFKIWDCQRDRYFLRGEDGEIAPPDGQGSQKESSAAQESDAQGGVLFVRPGMVAFRFRAMNAVSLSTPRPLLNDGVFVIVEAPKIAADSRLASRTCKNSKTSSTASSRRRKSARN